MPEQPTLPHSCTPAPPGSLPRLTIVTPCYEREAYLEEAIRSVLDQGYPDLEYMVVDGGSKNPRVVETIRRYEGRLAWWTSEPDGGHAEAIQRGFNRATGEIMTWLCSDDTYTPGALRLVGEAFQRHPWADVVFGNVNLIDGAGRFLKELRGVPVSRLPIPPGVYHQSSVFFRKALYERVGGMDLEYNRYATDHELFYRFGRARARFLFLRRVLSNTRLHESQTTAVADDQVSAYRRRALRQHYPWIAHPCAHPFYEGFRVSRHAALLLLQGDGPYLARVALRRARRLLSHASR
ncbi:MAG: glycosyltransferase [Armatimonadetes bacterium]|nr:glycosyltransferase [Armatimonadota bacterium]